jgi:hypothetical protein
VTSRGRNDVREWETIAGTDFELLMEWDLIYK